MTTAVDGVAHAQPWKRLSEVNHEAQPIAGGSTEFDFTGNRLVSSPREGKRNERRKKNQTQQKNGDSLRSDRSERRKFAAGNSQQQQQQQQQQERAAKLGR